MAYISVYEDLSVPWNPTNCKNSYSSFSMYVCLPVTIQEGLIRIESDLSLEKSVKCLDVLQLWLNP